MNFKREYMDVWYKVLDSGKISGAAGETPLMFAAASWDAKAVCDLILSGHSHALEKDAKKKTALHHFAMAEEVDWRYGVEYGNLQERCDKIVPVLLKAKCDVEERDHNGCTPLTLAAAYGSDEAVNTLLAHGANANARDESGSIPLDHARRIGRIQIAQLLLRKGSGWDTKTVFKQVEEKMASTQKDTLGLETWRPAEWGRVLGRGRTMFMKRKTPGAGNESESSDSDTECFFQEKKSMKKAREYMEEARKPDVKPRLIKKAIKWGRKAGIPEEEISDLPVLLELVEQAGTLETRLNEAIRKGDLPELEKIIGHLQTQKPEGFPEELIEKAEAAVEAEKSKAEALERYRTALESGDANVISAAVSIARLAGVPDSEMEVGVAKEREAKELKKKQEDSKNVKAQLQSTLLEAKKIDWEDPKNLEAMTKICHQLGELIARGDQLGLPDMDLKQPEIQRRRLHNSLQSVIGNVRVYSFVRPLLRDEKDGGRELCVKVSDTGVEVNHEHSSRCGCPKGNVYGFDATFGTGEEDQPGTASALQDEVFSHIEPLVQSLFDGFNVTVLAYGQTGAGKTYTMDGNANIEGINQMIFREIFKILYRSRGQKKKPEENEVMFSMVEMRRADVIDLLHEKEDGKKQDDAGNINVKIEKDGTVSLEGVAEYDVTTFDELMDMYKQGKNTRDAMMAEENRPPERSHVITIIKIKHRNKATGDVLRGKMLLCDLAGSERMKQTKVSVDIQKEMIEINKALSAIGDVLSILSLGKKGAAVPYRNHKLTQVMQDTLGAGSAKTVVLMHMIPSLAAMDETVISLKWANRVKKIVVSEKGTSSQTASRTPKEK